MIHQELFKSIKCNDTVTVDLTFALMSPNVATDEYKNSPIVKGTVVSTYENGGFLLELPNEGLIQISVPQHVLHVEFGDVK